MVLHPTIKTSQLRLDILPTKAKVLMLENDRFGVLKMWKNKDQSVVDRAKKVEQLKLAPT